MTSDHVNCQAVDVIRTVVRVVIDSAQHQTFRLCVKVLVSVRPGSRRNAVGLAVDGTHRKPDRALLEGLDVRLHGPADFGGLLREQGDVDDVDHVVGVDPAGHERELHSCFTPVVS